MKQLILSILAILLFACGGPQNSAENADASESTESSQTEEQTAEAEETAAQPDVVDLAMETSNLSTLVAAVKAADLVSTLKGEGPFTVFAPTNAAFDALPDGTLDNLLKPENKQQLADILTYHVVAGKVMSTDLSDGMSATTVNGADITVSIQDGTVKINDATVTTADVEASNGVVHIIDTVIMPPQDQ